MNTIRSMGRGAAAGALLAVGVGGIVACGEGFGGSNCKLSRTCEPAAGGAPSSAGSNDGPEQRGESGAPADPAAGGAGNDVECSSPADCDNGDASDGAEACVDGACIAGNAPPAIVSVTPGDGAVDAEPDGAIVVEVSEPLDPATVTADSVQLLDGERTVGGDVSYADQKITFKPRLPLGLLAPYELVVSTALTDAEGASLEAEHRSRFQVRDGKWSVRPVAPGPVSVMSPLLQLSARGEALVAWSGPSAGKCPAQARWFARGEPLSPTKSLVFSFDRYCGPVAAAVSPGGLAFVAWYEEDGDDESAKQGVRAALYRDGKWGLTTSLNSQEPYNDVLSVAVTDDGLMHYADSSSLWSTSIDAAWSEDSRVGFPGFSRRAQRIAIAPGGDAVMAVRVHADGNDRLMASRFSRQGKKWGKVETLPGSDVVTSGTEVWRGKPAVAMSADGEPMVVWRRDAEFVSTRFSSIQGSWAGFETVAGGITAPSEPDKAGFLEEAPALVFDGKTFVAAFVGKIGGEDGVHVARFDRAKDEWQKPELVSEGLPAIKRMPRLTTDEHGNLLLVWPTELAESGTFGLAFQRFDAVRGKWRGAQLIADAAVLGIDVWIWGGEEAFTLGGNASGLAAVTLLSVERELRLASFH